MIVTSHKEGMGSKSISNKFNNQVSTLQSIIKKLNFGYSVKNLNSLWGKGCLPDMLETMYDL